MKNANQMDLCWFTLIRFQGQSTIYLSPTLISYKIICFFFPFYLCVVYFNQFSGAAHTLKLVVLLYLSGLNMIAAILGKDQSAVVAAKTKQPN